MLADVAVEEVVALLAMRLSSGFLLGVASSMEEILTLPSELFVDAVLSVKLGAAIVGASDDGSARILVEVIRVHGIDVAVGVVLVANRVLVEAVGTPDTSGRQVTVTVVGPVTVYVELQAMKVVGSVQIVDQTVVATVLSVELCVLVHPLGQDVMVSVVALVTVYVSPPYVNVVGSGQ